MGILTGIIKSVRAMLIYEQSAEGNRKSDGIAHKVVGGI